jgi:hypothetical protein
MAENQTLTIWLVALPILVIVLYFLSSGVAFVAMYKWPNDTRQRFYSWFYEPLEAAARNSYSFAQAYQRFQHWCWRAAGKPGLYWDGETWTTQKPPER